MELLVLVVVGFVIAILFAVVAVPAIVMAQSQAKKKAYRLLETETPTSTGRRQAHVAELGRVIKTLASARDHEAQELVKRLIEKRLSVSSQEQRRAATLPPKALIGQRGK